MIDSIQLREAITYLRGNHGYTFEYAVHRDLVIEAAESTLPKTKMVEQWRVEFAQEKVPYSASFHHESLAVAYAKTVRSWANTDCIRVTGPHQQEVPI